MVAKDPFSNPLLESELGNISSSMRMEDVFPIIGYPRRILWKKREGIPAIREINRICFLVEGDYRLDSIMKDLSSNVYNSLLSTYHTANLAYYIIRGLHFSVESHRKVKPVRTNPVWRKTKRKKRT